MTHADRRGRGTTTCSWRPRGEGQHRKSEELGMAKQQAERHGKLPSVT
ncbi:hypothetical protein [Paenibacillus zeisoli]|nr:hypothetical protein [Paenibacillus zeisoli]